METKFEKIDKDIVEVKGDISTIKTEVGNLGRDFADVKNTMNNNHAELINFFKANK